MTTATVANAKPTSSMLTAAADRAGAIGAGRDGAGAAAAGAGLAGGAEVALATGAAGAAVCAEPTGALGAGILMDGPPAGFGGRLMRTVCFFWAASADFGGSAAGAAGGGTGEVGSDIGISWADARDGAGVSQTVYE